MLEDGRRQLRSSASGMKTFVTDCGELACLVLPIGCRNLTLHSPQTPRARRQRLKRPSAAPSLGHSKPPAEVNVCRNPPGGF